MIGRLKNFGLLVLFTGIPIAAVYFLDAKHDPIVLLTAALIGVTAYYSWTTYGQFDLARNSTIASIRPLVIATRLSKEGEIGVYAGEEGKNRAIHLINVGAGHAHRVNIRISPPAEAFAKDENGKDEIENAIYVIQGVELPRNSKRMWNNAGAFCSSSRWHYMYAEYEDTEKNEYYTVQSGYNVKTGRIMELKQRIRKDDTDSFWLNTENNDWLENIDSSLKKWAEQQKILYKTRTRNRS